MTKLALLILTGVALSIGSGFAIGQGHRGGGGGMGGGGQGGHGGAAGSQPGFNRGGGGAGGAWGGSNWRGGGWSGGHWHGGYYGYRGYRYGGWGYPYYSFGFYPYYPYYYPYPAYPPYPLYADVAPPVYVERYPPPPEYAEPPPPQRAPTPPPTPERLERHTLSATELFEFDRAVLRLPQPKLDEIADAMARNPQINNVRIVGYTDRIGTDSYNLKLSQRRADAVKSYLVGKGVAPTRLIAVGWGKADPVVQCSDKLARPALIKCLEPNRRVVIEQITVERRVPASHM